MLCIQSDLAVGLNDLTDQQGDNSSDAALDRTELQCDRNRREDSKGQRDACGDLAQTAEEVDREHIEQVNDDLQAKQQCHTVYCTDHTGKDQALLGIRAPGTDDIGGQQDAVDQNNACRDGSRQAVADDQTKTDGEAGRSQCFTVHALFQILRNDRTQTIVENSNALVCQDRRHRANRRDDDVS